jgi:hypothetical protein
MTVIRPYIRSSVGRGRGFGVIAPLLGVEYRENH